MGKIFSCFFVNCPCYYSTTRNKVSVNRKFTSSHNFQVLSTKSLKKQMKKIKNMTVKDMVTTLASFYWSVLLGLLHVALSVARGFCRIFSSTFMGGNLVEGAKTLKVTVHVSKRKGLWILRPLKHTEHNNFLHPQVSELLANMPDPTQDEVKSEWEDRDKRTCSDRSSTKEDLADLEVNTSEIELLSDIFGLDLRREGGQYKITPHNPNASLTELLNSPIPSSAPPTAPPTKLRQRHQVSLFPNWKIIIYSHASCSERQYLVVQELLC